MATVLKRFTLICLWLFLISPRLSGQEPDQIIILPDSSLRIPPETEESFDISNMFSLPSYFKYGLGSLPQESNEQKVGLSSFRIFIPSDERTLYIDNMWQSELAYAKKNRTLWMILGSVEMGGAAYIAYRHIKKYGFW